MGGGVTSILQVTPGDPDPNPPITPFLMKIHPCVTAPPLVGTAHPVTHAKHTQIVWKLSSVQWPSIRTDPSWPTTQFLGVWGFGLIFFSRRWGIDNWGCWIGSISFQGFQLSSRKVRKVWEKKLLVGLLSTLKLGLTFAEKGPSCKMHKQTEIMQQFHSVWHERWPWKKSKRTPNNLVFWQQCANGCFSRMNILTLSISQRNRNCGGSFDARYTLYTFPALSTFLAFQSLFFPQTPHLTVCFELLFGWLTPTALNSIE